jgi:hypothetical protein
LYLNHTQTAVLQRNLDRRATRVQGVFEEFFDRIRRSVDDLYVTKVSQGRNEMVRGENCCGKLTSDAAIWLTTSWSSLRIGFGPTGIASSSIGSSILLIHGLRDPDLEALVCDGVVRNQQDQARRSRLPELPEQGWTGVRHYYAFESGHETIERAAVTRV